MTSQQSLFYLERNAIACLIGAFALMFIGAFAFKGFEIPFIISSSGLFLTSLIITMKITNNQEVIGNDGSTENL
jgi:hypothetical protein